MAKYNSKLTTEVCSKICKALKKGHSIRGACGYAGIGERTYYEWYNRGQQAKSGKYKQFVCDVDNARQAATFDVEDVVIDAIPNDVNTAKWWLVKHNPDTYGDRQYNETKVDANIQSEMLLKLERPLPELNDDP